MHCNLTPIRVAGRHCLLHAFAPGLRSEGLSDVSTNDAEHKLLQELQSHAEYYRQFMTETDEIVDGVRK